MATILLVEDNQNTADFIIRILESAGHDVCHAKRGLEGARWARASRPDLVLMDIDLPDVNGRSVVLSLRRNSPASILPIIAVTVQADDESIKLAKGFGCNAFLAKPFLPEDLLNLVDHFLPNSTASSPEANVE
ncbi:MAG: response regulator transcription factor [Anaerolineae bacterium]|nr:response regulator transcription factor [Anaerolineae bacterium]